MQFRGLLISPSGGSDRRASAPLPENFPQWDLRLRVMIDREHVRHDSSKNFQLDLFTLRRRSLQVRRSLLPAAPRRYRRRRPAGIRRDPVLGPPMTLAGQLGMRPLIARCQFGLTVDVRVLTRMASLLE
jgi:hypothetical protein